MCSILFSSFFFLHISNNFKLSIFMLLIIYSACLSLILEASPLIDFSTYYIFHHKILFDFHLYYFSLLIFTFCSYVFLISFSSLFSCGSLSIFKTFVLNSHLVSQYLCFSKQDSCLFIFYFWICHTFLFLFMFCDFCCCWKLSLFSQSLQTGSGPGLSFAN